MHAFGNVVKWSFYASAIAGLLIIAGMLSIWLMVEVLVFMVGIGT